MARPSEPLLKLLRDALKKRGLSTSELANRAGVERGELKRRLTGAEDLTVDQFIAIAQALELQQDMAALVGAPVEPDPETEEGAVAGTESVSPIHTLRTQAEEPADPAFDPFANAPRELVRAGFTWGYDLFLHFDAKQLVGSGVPESILSKFPDVLPIRLESRWHRHNRPEFGADAFTVILSFDILRTCTFPWSSLRTVQFTIPEEAVPPPPAPAPPEPPAPLRPALRLVKD